MRRSTILTLLIVVASASFVLSPLSAAYVTSDSMEPSIQENAIVALNQQPTAIQEGDVIMFSQPNQHRGEQPVLHRVVTVNDDGSFITKGDGNGATDQDRGASPVERSDVHAEAVTFNGGVVTLLGFPFIVENAVLVGAGGAVISLIWITLRNSDATDRWVRWHEYMRPALFVLFVFGVASMMFGAPTDTVVISEDAGTVEVKANVDSPPLTYSFVSSESYPIQVTETSSDEIMFDAVMNGDTGPLSVSVHSYPAVLPRSVVAALYSIHPIAAATGVMSVITMGVWLLIRVITDPDMVMEQVESLNAGDEL